MKVNVDLRGQDLRGTLKAVELNKWNYELNFTYQNNVKEYKMARLPRLSIVGCPQHIIQRGNNRQACFFCRARLQSIFR